MTALSKGQCDRMDSGAESDSFALRILAWELMTAVSAFVNMRRTKSDSTSSELIILELKNPNSLNYQEL
jgi:hypothetical protein